MKIHNSATSLFVFSLGICHSAFALWPIPRSLQTGTTLVKLSSGFDIHVNGISKVPQDLQDAISRTKTRLRSDKLQRLVVGRGAIDSAALTHAPSLSKLTLSLTPSAGGTVNSIMQEATKDIEKRSESYSLTLPSSNGGTATITANSSLGLFRGLTTFEQLWYDDSTGVTYFFQAPVTITNDFPAYVCKTIFFNSYLYIFFVALPRFHVGYVPKFVGSTPLLFCFASDKGTHLSSFAVSDIKRTLDAMSMVKVGSHMTSNIHYFNNC